jgi:hypothetical protein
MAMERKNKQKNNSSPKRRKEGRLRPFFYFIPSLSFQGQSYRCAFQVCQGQAPDGVSGKNLHIRLRSCSIFRENLDKPRTAILHCPKMRITVLNY